MFLYMVHSARSIGYATVVMLATCGMARAQLTNCRDPGPPEAFKIFVDEVRVSGGSVPTASVQAKLQTIHKFLYENLRASSGDNASVRDCGKRYPNDPADFDSTEFGGLDNLRVVLEVWGALDNPTKGSGTLGFALIPAHSIAPPAVFIISSDNLLNSLRQGRQIGAFAPLVSGISQYQNRNYAGAIPLLCAGTQQLTPVLSGQAAFGDAAFLSRQQALMKRVREMTDAAVKEARKTQGSPFSLWSPSSDGTFVCPK
ncbi:MAG TPA: hypothetical protein VGN16_04590 [Acidobacteriaceae bacterium]|jgi:hypothetical protein